jgi:hypothetical protein
MAGGWNLKFNICFMATTHELLHLGKPSVVQWNIIDIHTYKFWVIIPSTDFLNMVMVEFSNYWGECKAPLLYTYIFFLPSFENYFL